MEKSNIEKFNEKYLEIQEKYNLPSFRDMDENFEISKLAEKEDGILIRNIRRIIVDKISFHLTFIEILSGNSPAPSFLFAPIKNLSEDDRKEIKKLYKKFSKIYIESLKLDIIFNEQEEIDFIKKQLSDWEIVKTEMLSLMEKIEKEFEKTSENKDSSYFG